MLNASEMAWRWAFDRWQRTSMMTFSSVPRPFIATRLKSIDLLIKIIHNKNGKTITVLWRQPSRQTKLPVQKSQLVLPRRIMNNVQKLRFTQIWESIYSPSCAHYFQDHWATTLKTKKHSSEIEIPNWSLLICVILTLKNMYDCVGSIKLWKKRE